MEKLLCRLRRCPPRVLIYGILLSISITILLTFISVSPDTGKQNVNSANRMEHEIFVERKTVRSLAILVMAAPKNTNARNVIRKTWAKDIPPDVCVLFVIGTKNLSSETVNLLQQEQSLHKDLVLLESLEESYKTLAQKLISMFEWADANLVFKHLMKVDEDSFVRAHLIAKELLKKPDEKLYWGFFDGRAHVHKRGKWAEKDYVLCDRYIPYALGGGYVISSDLVKYVVSNAKYFMKFQSEDVSLGTWLAPMDIQRVHDPRFDTEYKSRGCFDSYLVTHKKSPEEMQVLHDSLQRSGNLCSKEFRVRHSYVYDWSDLPTKCCARTDTAVP